MNKSIQTVTSTTVVIELTDKEIAEKLIGLYSALYFGYDGTVEFDVTSGGMLRGASITMKQTVTK